MIPVLLHLFGGSSLAMWVVDGQRAGKTKICNLDKAQLLSHISASSLKWYARNHQIGRLEVSMDDDILTAYRRHRHAL